MIYYILFITIYYIFLFLPFTTICCSFYYMIITIRNLGMFITIYSIYYKWRFHLLLFIPFITGATCRCRRGVQTSPTSVPAQLCYLQWFFATSKAICSKVRFSEVETNSDLLLLSYWTHQFSSKFHSPCCSCSSVMKSMTETSKVGRKSQGSEKWGQKLASSTDQKGNFQEGRGDLTCNALEIQCISKNENQESDNRPNQNFVQISLKAKSALCRRQF